MWFVFLDQAFEIAFGAAHEGEVGLRKIAFVRATVDCFPDAWEMSGNEAVCPLNKSSGVWRGDNAWIGHTGLRSHGVEHERKIACGAIVAFAKSGGED